MPVVVVGDDLGRSPLDGLNDQELRLTGPQDLARTLDFGHR